MEIQVKVLEVGKPEFIQGKGGKGGYQKVVVKFEGDKGEQSRPFMSFDPIFNEVKNLAVGAHYDVEIKKEGNYWNWVSVSPASDVKAASAPKGQSTGTDWNAKNQLDRERFEFEKGERQQFIIRQSCLANAISACQPDPDITEVLRVADVFVDWVNGTRERTAVVEDPAPAEERKGPGRPRKSVDVE